MREEEKKPIQLFQNDYTLILTREIVGRLNYGVHQCNCFML